nr:phospholipase A1-II 4-like [Nicotiana tomentosiformis]
MESAFELARRERAEEVSITVTGHRLSSLLANAVDIVVNQINKEFPVTAFVFACPRVGDENFKNAYDKFKDLQILRICNAPDPIPKVPQYGLVDASANDWRDVGFELSIDTTKSEYLKTRHKWSYSGGLFAWNCWNTRTKGKVQNRILL